MNKLLFFAFLLLSVGARLYAQEGRDHAPASVQRSFQRDYPEAHDAQWSSTQGQWHANFDDHSRYDRGEMVAHYDQRGRHIDSHIRYDPNDVPSPVVERARRRYPHARDYTYTRIEHPGGQPLFEVHLNLGSQNRTVYMDDHGRERRYDDHH